MDKDYLVALLTEWESQKNALEAAIAGARAALAALGASGESIPVQTGAIAATGGQAPLGPSLSLPRGAFLGKTVTEAVKLYLSAMRKKQTNKEIAQALKEGGLESAGNFDNYITVGLFRLKEAGELLRFDDGWGLADWYPESFRNRVVEKAENGGKRKAKKKPAPKEAKTRKGSSGKKVYDPPWLTPTPSAPTGLDARVLQCLKDGDGTPLSAASLAMVMDEKAGTLNLALNRLVKKGKLEKTEEGYSPLKAS